MKTVLLWAGISGLFFSTTSTSYFNLPKVELTKVNSNFLIKYMENRLQVFHDSIPAYQLGVKVDGKIINPYGGSFTHKPKMEDTVLFVVEHKNTGKILFKRKFLCIYKSGISKFTNAQEHQNDASFNFILNRDAQRFLTSGIPSHFELHADNVIPKNLSFETENLEVNWINDSILSIKALKEGKAKLTITHDGEFVTKKEFPVKAN